MFAKWCFKRYYKKMMAERKLSPTEWTITLKDVYMLYEKLPKSIINNFGTEELHQLRSYVGEFHYANVMDALDACRGATVAMREGEYYDAPPREIQRVALDQWLQPDGLACHFRSLTTDAHQAVREFVDAFENVDPAKVGYYKRKTVSVTLDMFALGEMLAELVTRD